jgi:4'-phosphopantetheinyl transferase
MTPFPTAHATPVHTSAAAARPGRARAGAHIAEAHIWALPPLPRPSSYFGLLDSTELERCSSFARESDLARFVTGRVLAKTALASVVGAGPEAIRLHARCPDCGGPHGKPKVLGAAEGWELSITHSGDVVAVALAPDHPLGLDVERADSSRGPGMPPEYDLVLTPAERAAVERLPLERRARACLTYWARKEAVLKATGDGLNIPMTDFTLSAPDAPAALLGWHPPDRARPVPALTDVDLAEGYHAAVAVLGAAAVLATVHDSGELLTARRPPAHSPAHRRHHTPATALPTERSRPARATRARSPSGVRQ